MQLLTLAVVLAASCPSREGVELLSSAVAVLERGSQPASICTYGFITDTGSEAERTIVYRSDRKPETLLLPNRHQERGGPLNAQGRILVEDLNFDGCKDIAVPWLIAGGNASFHVWVYQTATRSFAYDSILSHQGALDVDSTLHEVRSRWNGGGGQSGAQVFRWERSVFVVVRRESVAWSDSRGCSELTTEYVRAGRVVRTTHQCRE